jgi:predicted phage terminase large subunit-like protein
MATTASTELRLALERSVCEDSLLEFVRRAWRVLEPHTPFIENWHIVLGCRELERVTAGEIQKIVFNWPPGMTKSRLVSVFWPCWELTRKPWLRYMCFSYSADLATLHNMERRDLIRSAWYQGLWGDIVRLRDDHDLKTEIATTSPPGMITSAGVKGTATGKGGERLIVDDPLNPKQALSDADREAVETWWRQTLRSRLRDRNTGAIVLIMQRLHVDDPTGLALAEGGWHHICLPMEFDANHPYRCPDDPRTQDGELLCPARINRKQADEDKRNMGSYAAAGQWQQLPFRKGGNIWKTHLIRFYDRAPTQFDAACSAWDMNFKQTESGSYVVGQVWARRGADAFLLDEVRGRWGAAETIQAMLQLHARWPWVLANLVEDKANGPAVMDMMAGRIPGLIPVDTGRDSKTSRAEAVSPLIEGGNVYLPKSGLTRVDTDDWLAEAARFPQEPNDRVDAAVHALKWLFQQSSAERWTSAIFEAARDGW